MRWALEFTASAAKAFRKLERLHQVRVQQALEQFLQDLDEHRLPLRGDHKALTNRPGQRRLRVGDWRLIYTLEQDRLVVLVIDLGHRSSVY